MTGREKEIYRQRERESGNTEIQREREREREILKAATTRKEKEEN